MEDWSQYSGKNQWQYSRQQKKNIQLIIDLVNGRQRMDEYIKYLKQNYRQVMQQGTKTINICKYCGQKCIGRAIGPHVKHFHSNRKK